MHVSCFLFYKVLTQEEIPKEGADNKKSHSFACEIFSKAAGMQMTTRLMRTDQNVNVIQKHFKK